MWPCKSFPATLKSVLAKNKQICFLRWGDFADFIAQIVLFFSVISTVHVKNKILPENHIFGPYLDSTCSNYGKMFFMGVLGEFENDMYFPYPYILHDSPY